MKNLLLSTALAAGLGALALAPASAAGVTVKAPVAMQPVATDVACRTVEKRSTRNGVTKIVRTRECEDDYSDRRDYGDDRRVYREDGRRYVDRRDYRRDRYEDARPGLNIQLGN